MRFYLISNMYPTQKYPGYGSFVKNVSDKLSENGIIEYCRSVIYGRANTNLKKVVKYLSFYASILLNYWRKYDFIYIHFPNQAIPILLPLLKLYRRKLVVNLHGEDLIYSDKGYAKLLGKSMEMMCKKYANAIVVPSSYFKKIVEERQLVPHDRIIVSPSGGINSQIFYPLINRNFCSDRIHLGYVGRMEKDKGIIEFINVCKELTAQGVPFFATAIGYGSLYPYVKEFISNNGLYDTFELIEGMSQTNLGSYYRSFDILIFSSSRTGESLGLTGIEAMACGTPVIGSNIGGIATYLKNGVNGWLTPVNDINAIIEKIKIFRSLTKEEKKRMSENASLTGEKYYSEFIVQELKILLLAILNHK